MRERERERERAAHRLNRF